MPRPSLRSLLAATIVLLLLVPAVALAHEERASQFPDGTGTVPTYREFGDHTDRIVVCKGDSADRIAQIDEAELRARNEALLEECEFEHIQAAVNAVAQQGTTIYVLPGVYREEPSVQRPCAVEYDEEQEAAEEESNPVSDLEGEARGGGGALEYEAMVECGEILNLITVAGDSLHPDDSNIESFPEGAQEDPDGPDEITCDNALCDLQIEGMGETPQDTKVLGGFDEEGDWRKHNGIKADRADGFVLANMAFELFRENAIYVHETDGYLLDRVEANYNDLYGILTFTADHGVISNCETHHNGDSGVYPGSASDVNQGEYDPVSGLPTYTAGTGPLERWSVEIFNCDTHHNALGFSGTAGNSVWFHDNVVHHNGAGYVTDSFVPNHPGMPQDHAFLENNLIYANNSNYYPNVQGEDAPCADPVPENRGHQDGVVCPAFPVPVGTGVLIAGGNHNLVRNNQIYDNWRNGVMQFYVPAAIREEVDPRRQFDVSNDNWYVDNAFGAHPDGYVQPNGTDVWWDDQGTGNCWQGNTTTAEGGEVTHNSTFPDGLPDCDSDGSVNPAPNPEKSGVLVPCAVYDREDNPDPEGCDWFDSPIEPAGREAAPGEPTPNETASPGGGTAAEDADALGNLAATGGGSLAALLGLGAALAAGRMRRRDQDGTLA